MNGYGLAILLGITAIGVAVALGIQALQARGKRVVALGIIPLLRAKFDELAGSDGIITNASLKAAVAKLPNNAAEIRLLSANIGRFGHDVGGTDDATKGALAATLAVTSPAAAPLAFADGGVSVISKEDVERLSHVTVDWMGTVHVFVFTKKKSG